MSSTESLAVARQRLGLERSGLAAAGDKRKWIIGALVAGAALVAFLVYRGR